MASYSPDLDSLLASAVEIGDADDREAYLQRVCQGDAERLAELRSMVHDYFAAGSLIDRPAQLAPTLAAESQPQLGTRIGPYTLRELLGEAGGWAASTWPSSGSRYAAKSP